MKKFMISIAAICATLFFVSCGDSKTPEKVDDTDTATDTDTDTNDNPDTETDTEPTEEPTNPTDEPTNPTEEPTNPTEPTDEPTEDPTEPTDDPTEPTEEPQECELSELEQKFVGTWAQKIILRSKSSTTLAKNVPSVTTRYIVTEIKPNKDCKLDFFKKGNQICRTDNRTGDNIANKGVVKFNEPDSKFNTIFHHWKPADLPGHENDVYLEIAEEGGEKTFKLNKDWELRGANMTDPSTEDMIEEKTDERIFDHDNDGKSAFTIAFNGFVSGPLYYVQRLSHVLTGKVVSEGKIEGNVEWSDEQYAHPDTPNKTLAGQKTTVTDTSKSVFQLVKVDDSMDCATLLEKAGEIFDIVDPNTDVPLD